MPVLITSATCPRSESFPLSALSGGLFRKERMLNNREMLERMITIALSSPDQTCAIISPGARRKIVELYREYEEVIDRVSGNEMRLKNGSRILFFSNPTTEHLRGLRLNSFIVDEGVADDINKVLRAVTRR